MTTTKNNNIAQKFYIEQCSLLLITVQEKQKPFLGKVVKKDTQACNRYSLLLYIYWEITLFFNDKYKNNCKLHYKYETN